MPPEKFSDDDILSLLQSAMTAGGTAPAAPAPAPAAPPPPAPVAPPPVAAPAPVPMPVAAPPPVPLTVPLPVSPVAPPPMSPIAAPPPPPAASAAPAAPAAPAAAEPISPEVIREVDDLGHQFEIGRVRMEQVLTPFIGDKVTKKMLAWSLDRAQKTHAVLKNTHWSPSGDLLDNGEIEVGKLVKNLETLGGQPPVQAVKLAFSDLLVIRLEAVEKGLGPSMKQAVEKEVKRLGDILK